jgi:hypothetical protein
LTLKEKIKGYQIQGKKEVLMKLGRRSKLTIGLAAGLLLVLSLGMIVPACSSPVATAVPDTTGSEGPDTTAIEELEPSARIWGEIIPEEGTANAYGIPLSLQNTRQFLNWYYSIELSAEEEAIKELALRPLVAPCCDQFPMSTCCCECNLARSVWGLSAYLITEQSYGADQLQEAALQWLHFIRPGYYVASALEQEGIAPEPLGFTKESSCFSGNCELPFESVTPSGHLGGCGGMGELIELETY